MFSKSTSTLVAAVAASAFAASSEAQLQTYTQNFEGLDRTNGSALDQDGYQLFVNVFDETGNNFVYNYGPFPAPNDIANPNISVISDAASGGNPPAGDQGLVIFNDYNNGDHGNGTNRRIEVNVFQQQTIGAADLGQTYTFSFLAAPVLDGNGQNVIAGSDSDAIAFIKTLDPNNGFAQTNFITLDTSALTGPENLSIDIDILDPLLVGQILQFGFANTADNFGPTAVNYDNLSFSNGLAIPEPASAALLAIGGTLLIRRRRRA